MKNDLNWEIFYSYGDECSDVDFTPWSLERRMDVQVIVQKDDDHKWVTLSGYDYYIWVDRGNGERWHGVDLFGLHHYLLKSGYKCVIFGTKLDDNRFREIFDRARSKLGDKTIFAKDERRP